MNSLTRIYRLKTTLVAIILAVLGLAMMLLAKWAESQPSWAWLTNIPAFELGSTLFITGSLVVAWDYVDGKDKERRDDERIRKLLKESAPDFRDAVVKGFVASPDDLKAVATPHLLDQIATNALGLRLGDKDFAAELYEGLRDQAVRAPERWYGAQVRIRLSSMEERDTKGVPLFSLLVQWEYTVTPSKSVQKFACTSDRDGFRDLISDVPSTSTWFMTPRPGLHANDRACFELLQYAVNGEERRIRRSERKTGQTYAVTIGDDVVKAGKPVRITHTYRTVTAKSGHRLRITVAQPTRDLSVSLDYTDSDIASIATSDLVSSVKRARTSTTPEGVAAREITVDVPGWLLPPAEITYVWTLASEQDATDHEARAVA